MSLTLQVSEILWQAQEITDACYMITEDIGCSRGKKKFRLPIKHRTEECEVMTQHHTFILGTRRTNGPSNDLNKLAKFITARWERS
jgi:hypothetical protein